MRFYKYPLPQVSNAGGATEAKQDDQIVLLTSLDGKDFSTSAKQDTTNGKLDTLIAKDFSTSAKQDTTNTKLDTIIANTALIGANTNLAVVDQIDSTPLLDVSLSNIPASGSNSLEIVNSLALAVKKVVTVEDIGEFFGLYSGPVATPTLLCVLPLGGGEMDVIIPAGALVSIRHMKNTAITSGFIAINFLG